MMRRLALVLLSCAALCGCESLDHFLGDGPPEVKRAKGERLDVVVGDSAVTADASVAQTPIEVPEPTALTSWANPNVAMVAAPHIAFGQTHESQSATIGDGNDYSGAVAPAPVIANGLVYAMDARGVVSAHEEKDIGHVRWLNDTSVPKRVYDVLGGGLVIGEGLLFVSTGNGNVRAIDAVSGTTKWSIAAGAPVRGAPAVGNGIVVVLTADNQTLAFDAATGEPRWDHRGIRESAGFYSTTAPVVSDGIVVAAYSSGEVFALRAETGNVLWSDTLRVNDRTRADAVFNGIDAPPMVQDGVVVVTSATGEMQASALLNGRPLWQQKIGAHSMPWSAGNALFVLSSGHDVAALFKRNGAVRWATSLATHDSKDVNKDTTPALFGPVLAGGYVVIAGADGKLRSFKPDTGELAGIVKLDSGIASSPVFSNGALYVVTQDATLRKYF